MNHESSDRDIDSVKRLLGQMNEHERDAFDKSCDEDEVFLAQYLLTKKIWDKSTELDVATRINQSTDLEWELFRQKTLSHKVEVAPQPIFKKWLKVAAVMVPLILGGGLGVLYFSGLSDLSWERVATTDQIDSLYLQDNSFVVLNQASRIKYHFEESKREVKLDGVAYFKVAKDADRPFVVHLNQSKVKVLGTGFIIENIKGRNRVVVEVTDGKVEFSHGMESVRLIKGDKAVLANGKIEKQKVKIPSESGWIKRKIEFNSADIKEVGNILLMNYPQIKKIMNLTAGDTTKVTTVFENQPFNEVLEELEIHFNKKFRFSNGELTISD